ncbi:restriction endonuclease subunit S [Bifidobacterium biavatii]|uniref:Restriction modification system DNA specificity domain-containing protein n=1 Tax=Bifidobacterium biavatii DSM 23969 TaxID=1437608 RepID=A0A086ZEI4_9BIFI|nr:restriction endonuclease subunit S [Bifidobacterium biavatii]KFI44934.1 restriction modification system DNA specificity domain-containing protein [Bifidobacterium biavatii DSM 23969]
MGERLLKEVCEITYGFAFDSKRFSSDKATGMPVIRIRDLKEGTSYTYTDETCDDRYLIHDGDFLIGMDGEFNIVEWKGGDALLNQRVCKIRSTNDDLVPDFLPYILADELKHIESQTSYVTVKHLSAKVLNQIRFMLPSVDRQREIVKILKTVQNEITVAEQMLAKADELIQSRFVEMFMHDKYEDVLSSELMPDMRNGVSPSKRGAIPSKVLTLSAITQGDFDDSAWKEGVFDDDPSADKRVSSLDFYMCRGNGNKNLVGAGAYAERNYSDLVFPDTMIAGRVDTSKICMSYLFHVWRQPTIRKQIEGMARTTNGTYKVNQEMLSSISVPLPPLALQNEFAEFVTSVESLKSTTRQQLDRLTTLYASLTQRYFAQ